jgi:arylformamidase
MSIVDITGIIGNDMWTYGGPIGTPVISEVAAVDGLTRWQAHSISFWTLTGTYLEASAHLFEGGETIDKVDPERFLCPAYVIPLTTCPPRHPITSEELAATGMKPQRGAAALISTGWDAMWNTPDFVRESPFLTMDAMQWLIESGASIIGGDFPTFDNHAQPTGVNVELFKAGCLLLAPLVNLTDAGKLMRPYLIALPLRIKGVCGTPCRALLVEREGNF